MLIDRVYEKIIENRGEAFRLRPSNIGSCAEQLRRQLVGEKKEVPAKVMFAFKVGEAVHEKLVSELWKARGEEAGYVYIVSEKEVETAIGKGTLDLLVKDKNTDEVIVVDFKIVSDAHFGKVKKQALEGVGLRYLIQLALYCDAVKTQKGMLIFVNKDNGEFLEMPIDFKTAGYTIENLIEYAKRIKKAVEEGDDINLLSPLEAWECGYCSFVKDCIYKQEREKQKALIKFDEETLIGIQEQLEELNEKVKWLEEQKKAIIENINDTYESDRIKIVVTKMERADWDREELRRLVAPEVLQRIEKKREIVTKRVILK